MSDATDWVALGAKVQLAAEANAARLNKKDHWHQMESTGRQNDARMQIGTGIDALQKLKSECLLVVEKFNSVVSDVESRLTVVGGGPTRFTVVKGGGIPCVVFEMDADGIEVALHESSQTRSGGTDHYTIDHEGLLKIRSGVGAITAYEIVDAKIKLLIHTQSPD